ncbi:MAG TPA: hypothetical protein PKD64_19405 [Pirellulaceae bacterium]|nr:hypothetical protein [Pirellulaceae bacterium]HMO94359.1 hypothetical protein [Pirellulaceae bacterium]HMP70393.1 hypothetical protein [Pirellulaceae bacterium]
MIAKLTTTITLSLACIGVFSLGFCSHYLVNQSLGPKIDWPSELKADSSTSGKMMSCATGWINENVEGLFVLDHLTGTLFCWVIDPKSGALGASFQTNVTADLSPDGRVADVDYVMVTGSINFSGTQFTGVNRPARTIVYVGEGNSGRVGAYAVRFRAGTGTIERLGVGQTRAAGLMRE